MERWMHMHCASSVEMIQLMRILEVVKSVVGVYVSSGVLEKISTNCEVNAAWGLLFVASSWP